MRGRVAIGCGVAAVVLAIAGLIGGLVVRGWVRGGSVDEIAALLPAETEGVVVARGLIDLGIKLGPGFREGLGDAAPRVMARLGLGGGDDGLDLGKLTSTGFDPTRPAAAALLRRDAGGEEGDWVLLLPARDPEAVAEWMRGRFEAGLPGGVRAAGTAGESVWVAGDASTGGAVAFGALPGYVGVTGRSGGSGDPAAILEALRRPAGGRLAGAGPWEEVVGALGSDWHLMAYATPSLRGQVARLLSPAIARGAAEEIAADPHAGSVGLAVRIWSDGAEARLVQALGDGSPARRVLGGGDGGRPLPPLPGKPSFVARVDLDAEALWGAIQADAGSRSEAEGVASRLRRTAGLDLGRDVVAHLDGSCGIAFFEGGGTPISGALWFGVRDEEGARGALDRALGGLDRIPMGIAPRDVEGTSWRGIGAFGVELRFAVVGHRLVAVVGGVFEEVARALSGAGAAERKVPMLDGIAMAGARRALEAGPPVAAWMAGAGTERMARELLRTPGPEGAALGDLLLTAEVDGPGLRATLASQVPARAMGVAAGRLVAAVAGDALPAPGQGEVLGHLDRLRALQKARAAAGQEFLALPGTPAEVPGRGGAPFEGPGAEAFRALGWDPPPRVMCRYAAEPSLGPWGPDVKIAATCDLDGDGRTERFEASALEAAHAVDP